MSKQYLGYEGVVELVSGIKEADAKVLSDAKGYADGLADNYDPAGTAQTKVDALANGQVKANTDTIAAETERAIEAEAANKALAEAAQAAADAAQAAADKAQEEVDAVEVDLGNVDGLSTTNKTVVGAINEVLAAVGTGGTAAVVTVTTDTTTDGALKSYTIKQGETTVGVIDIPKDMVVESGSVVTNPEGQAEGTYIKLVLANVAEPLYINVGTLVDIYKAKENAAQVQISIDSSTREISASIVAGSVTSTELADNAVITAKIADANVTKEKLSTEVQASLGKADAAAPQTALDAEIARATAAEGQALTDAKAYTDAEVLKDRNRLDAIEGQLGDGDGSVTEQIAEAEQNAKDYADGLNTAMDTRVQAVEGKAHEHSNKALLDTYTQTEENLADAVAKKHEHSNAAELDKIADGDVAKWNAAEQNAKDYADGLAGNYDASGSAAQALTDSKAYTDAEIAKIDLSGIETNASDIDKLEASLEEGGATANAIAAAQAAADKAQEEVDALELEVADFEAISADTVKGLFA